MENPITNLVKIPWINKIRLFAYHKVFGAATLTGVPDDFLIPKLFPIQNQNPWPFCFAHGFCSVSEDDEKVKLDECLQAAFAYDVLGKINPNGCDLVTVCKSGIKYGSGEKGLKVPDSLDINVVGKLSNYDQLDILKAAIHKKKGYVEITGPYDTFDNIRSVIFAQKKAALSGCAWRFEYWYPANGVIPNLQTPTKDGHAFVIRGWKMVNGQLCLIAQLSNGEGVGVGGYVYFTREIVNREFTYGNLLLVDLDVNAAKQNTWTTLQKMIDYLVALLTKMKGQKMSLLDLIKSKIGTDFTNDSQVPDTVSCSFAVTTLLHEYDSTLPVIDSTELFCKYMQSHPERFMRLPEPVTGIQGGDIVISPTGSSTILQHGHVGMYIDDTNIVSNSSETGLWSQNYTRTSWRSYFHDYGKFPVYIFRLIK